MSDLDACVEWQGPRDNYGYGTIRGHRTRAKAHRVAWEQANGPIPDGMAVLHRCDNPPCVRVSHLFLGTQADNMHDMAAKGRGTNQYAQRMTCPRGHPYDYIYRGNRYCKRCGVERKREARAKARATA